MSATKSPTKAELSFTNGTKITAELDGRRAVTIHSANDERTEIGTLGPAGLTLNRTSAVLPMAALDFILHLERLLGSLEQEPRR